MKFTRIFLIAVAALILASCGGKKDKPTEEIVAGAEKMPTVGADSAAVRKLVSDFMDQVVAGNYDLAVDMLVQPDLRDSINAKPLPLPEDVRNEYLSTFKEFNVTDYAIRRITFDDYTDNEVQCEIVIDSVLPTNWYFKPVKIVGEWFLCMRDTNRGDRPMHMDD